MVPDAGSGADPVDAVLEVIAAGGRGTPRQVLRAAAERAGVPLRVVRAAVRRLVAEGTLTYTHLAGTSFLERSFAGPVRVSRRLWLCPPRRTPEEADHTVAVRLHPGAAFGCGDHPTTRLALRGIDFAVGGMDGVRRKTAVDIGTGSGVLAIAAALLGVGRVLALDIDSCARVEAAANVAENGLSDRIAVSGQSPAALAGPFSLVLANLRPPTLSALSPIICKMAAPGAWAVLSGFRRREWVGLAAEYGRFGWRPLWRETESGWTAVVCRRPAS